MSTLIRSFVLRLNQRKVLYHRLCSEYFLISFPKIHMMCHRFEKAKIFAYIGTIYSLHSVPNIHIFSFCSEYESRRLKLKINFFSGVLKQPTNPNTTAIGEFSPSPATNPQRHFPAKSPFKNLRN